MIILATTTSILIAGVLIFLLITLLLVGILLYVKTKLTPEGTVVIDINDGKISLETNPGNTLLSTLGNNKIFLPSACGGVGTCGMCRCQVNSGAGSILPTETDFFTRKEQSDNWRLACQVKVRTILPCMFILRFWGSKNGNAQLLQMKMSQHSLKNLLSICRKLKFLSSNQGGISKSMFHNVRSISKTSTLVKNSALNGKEIRCLV